MNAHWHWVGRIMRSVASLSAVFVFATASRAAIIEQANTGRFLRIRNDGTASRQLHIGEVEAFLFGITPAAGLDNANDVALPGQGASFERRVGPFQHGSNAAVYDGVLQTGGATFSMNPGVNNEFMIDLGTDRALGDIRVWQRADGCCQDRLSDFAVSLLENNGGLPGAEVASRTFNAQAPTNSYALLDMSERVIQPGGAGSVGTEIVDGANARFVRVRNDGTASRQLHIGEIEAFASGVTPAAGVDNANDLALDHRGASFESRVGPLQHGSNEAVYDGVLQTGAFTFSLNPGVGNEYVLDLGQTRTLDAVRVWQRADGCCQDRLSDFSVSLLADNGAGLPGAEVSSLSHSGNAPTNSFASFSFGAGNQYRLGQGDTLAIDVNATAGTADKLSVGAGGTGQLSLGAGSKLRVNVMSGTPAVGDKYDVIDAGATQGTFAKKELPALTGNQFWNLSELYSTGEIQVSDNVLTETGIQGRFIRVRNDGTANRSLHIGEIETFEAGTSPLGALDNANDVALNTQGASFESAVGGGGHGSTAAVYDGALQTGAAVWTRGAVGAEYVLDLGQTRDLGSLRVWQRADGCCQDRLSDFTISVLGDDGSGSPGAVVYNESFSGNAPTNAYAAFDLPTTLHVGGDNVIGTAYEGDTEGRFIRVRNNVKDTGEPRYLHIGEIEAFEAGVEPAPGLDNVLDLALGTKGASFESFVGSLQHGTTGAVFDGVRQSAGATFSLNPAVGSEFVLDLGETWDLGTVRVWQRVDCCYDRLADFTLSLLADDGTGNPGREVYSESFPGQVPDNSFTAFTVRQQFTLEDHHTLAIELDGTTNTSDVFLVGTDGLGILNIEPGATLDVSLIAGTLDGAPVFDILDFGTVNGTFGTVNLPALRAAQSWDLSDLYLTGEIALHVPEPATWLLFGLGALGLLYFGRRRLARASDRR